MYYKIITWTVLSLTLILLDIHLFTVCTMLVSMESDFAVSAGSALFLLILFMNLCYGKVVYDSFSS